MRRRLNIYILGLTLALVGLMLVGSGPSHAATLKVGLMDEPKTLNPFAARDVWSAKVLTFLYQRLYYREPKTDELVPWLASDQPVWDPDTNTVTFHLKEAQWADGSPFSAEDVLFTADLIRRFRLPKYYRNWDFVTKVEAPDPHTVRLTLEQPMAILYDRTLSTFIVQKKHWAPVVEKAEKALQEALAAQQAQGKAGNEALEAALAKPLEILTTYSNDNPESMGPFTFKQWQKGAFVHLVRNERFFALNGGIAGHPVGPHVDDILMKIYGNMDTAILALKKGDIDYLWWSIESGYLKDLEKDPDIKIFSTLKSGYRYLSFNFNRPPLGDKIFRQAVAYLVDKAFIVQRVLHREGVRLDTVVPPDNAIFFNPDTPTYGKELTWKAKVQKAHDMLVEAGYSWEVEPVPGELTGQYLSVGKGLKMPSGEPVPSMNLLTPPADYDPQRAQAGNLIQQWLQGFGVPINWRPMSFGAMIKQVRKEQDFDMFVSGWSLGPDPDYLRSFFHSGSSRNSGGYNNPLFDELVVKQATIMDVQERRQLVFRLQQILMEDLPYIPLYVPINLEGVRTDRFQGWVDMQGGIGNLWTFLQVKPVK
jgi:peptide/nickel transport system substrate-binding protein